MFERAAVAADVAAPEGSSGALHRPKGHVEKHAFHLLPSHMRLPGVEAASPSQQVIFHKWSQPFPSKFPPSAQSRPTEKRSRSENSSGNLNIWRLWQNHPVAFKHLRASAMRMCWPPHLGTITALQRTMWTAPIVYKSKLWSTGIQLLNTYVFIWPYGGFKHQFKTYLHLQKANQKLLLLCVFLLL